MGIARLSEEIERDIANDHRLDVVSARASAETVTARVEVQTVQTRAAGVDRIIQVFTVTTADGQIVALQAANDADDPTTVAFMRQRRGQ